MKNLYTSFVNLVIFICIPFVKLYDLDEYNYETIPDLNFDNDFMPKEFQIPSEVEDNDYIDKHNRPEANHDNKLEEFLYDLDQNDNTTDNFDFIEDLDHAVDEDFKKDFPHSSEYSDDSTDDDIKEEVKEQFNEDFDDTSEDSLDDDIKEELKQQFKEEFKTDFEDDSEDSDGIFKSSEDSSSFDTDDMIPVRRDGSTK